MSRLRLKTRRIHRLQLIACAHVESFEVQLVTQITANKNVSVSQGHWTKQTEKNVSVSQGHGIQRAEKNISVSQGHGNQRKSLSINRITVWLERSNWTYDPESPVMNKDGGIGFKVTLIMPHITVTPSVNPHIYLGETSDQFISFLQPTHSKCQTRVHSARKQWLEMRKLDVWNACYPIRVSSVKCRWGEKKRWSVLSAIVFSIEFVIRVRKNEFNYFTIQFFISTLANKFI